MSCRKIISSKTSYVCTGSFDRKIKIQTSSIAGNNSRGVQSVVSFKDLATVWAMIKTNISGDFIDGVQVGNGVNTDFYIRYNSKIDFEQQLWVEYKNNRFKIVSIDNIDKDDLVIRLRSVEKGDKTILVNAR
tara:strand:+ start:351 stop:746 length:396 start_codon:yes stop_codon:yes gene_type:complete